MPSRLVLLALLLNLAPAAADSPDYERERHHADALRHGRLDGEPLELRADGRSFFNLFTETDGPARGAVIVLHGRGLHPDWPAVVRPLRVGLARRGWATLAMQMPVLAKGAEYADYVRIMPLAGPRLEAGIRYLRQQGFERIHLVAHSCGAQMTMHWLDHGGGAGLDSVTFISLGIVRYGRQFGHRPPLDRLALPVLDVYGSRDFVADRAAERRALIEAAGHPRSRQVAIEGGRHMLKPHGERLVAIVADWLQNLSE